MAISLGEPWPYIDQRNGVALGREGHREVFSAWYWHTETATFSKGWEKDVVAAENLNVGGVSH